MKNRMIYLIGFFVIICSLAGLFAFKVKQRAQNRNYVSNESIAQKVAEVILTPIYGEEQIEAQKPFKVSLINDSIWVVKGTQNEISLGGTFYIEIQKSDCRILKVTHGK